MSDSTVRVRDSGRKLHLEKLEAGSGWPPGWALCGRRVSDGWAVRGAASWEASGLERRCAPCRRLGQLGVVIEP